MEAIATPTKIEITLTPESAQATIAKAKRLCERAAKKGLDGGWSVTGIEHRTETDERGITRLYDVLTLEGTPFSYNGYRFVAAVEWLEGAPFVRTLPGYDGDAVDRSLLVPGWCDHCETKRRRNAVYIVESDEGRKQVGSTCLKDFIGHDVAGVLVPDPDSASDGGVIGYWKPATPTIEVLAAALRVTREYGFASVAQGAMGVKPTKARVNEYLYGRDIPAQMEQRKIGRITEADKAEAQEIIDWIATEFTGYGDYAQNLRAAAALTITTDRTIGTLVSAIAAKDRSVQREIERASSTIIEERFAPDGEKITVDAEVATVRWIDGIYGTFAYVTLATKTHRFKWKATGRSVPAQGDRVIITGTVKGVDEWNGAVYTVLTRCKFSTEVAK